METQNFSKRVKKKKKEKKASSIDIYWRGNTEVWVTCVSHLSEIIQAFDDLFILLYYNEASGPFLLRGTTTRAWFILLVRLLKNPLKVTSWSEKLEEWSWQYHKALKQQLSQTFEGKVKSERTRVGAFTQRNTYLKTELNKSINCSYTFKKTTLSTWYAI